MLHRVEAECSHVDERSHSLTVIFAAQRMSSIFNQKQSMLACQFFERLDLCRMSGIVNGQDRFGFWRDLRLGKIRIEVERVLTNICENRCRALVEKAVRSRGKCHRRCNG